jgi:hypothetical protein
MFSKQCNNIFEQAVANYHQYNDIDKVCPNPFDTETIDNVLYAKCWIDTAQWHMEDEIRNPSIDPAEALLWKRRIDKSNQDRTDIVEEIDTYFFEKYNHIQPKPSARINTESPAWAVDRLSILVLKIYHMREETLRTDVDTAQLDKCSQKLAILIQQQIDLSLAIDELLADIEHLTRFYTIKSKWKAISTCWLCVSRQWAMWP